MLLLGGLIMDRNERVCDILNRISMEDGEKIKSSIRRLNKNARQTAKLKKRNKLRGYRMKGI